jgi:hypothetical protein
VQVTDLFGEPVVAFSGDTGFEEFWDAWPPGPRKVAKKQCLAKWIKLRCAADAGRIRLHVEWMKRQEDWIKSNGAFVPLVATYLTQERWSEWTPEPERPKRVEAIEIIRQHKGDACRPDVLQRLKEIRQGRTA